MIDPPRIANLLSAGQHNLNYFVVRKKQKKKFVVVFFLRAKVSQYRFSPFTTRRRRRSALAVGVGVWPWRWYWHFFLLSFSLLMGDLKKRFCRFSGRPRAKNSSMEKQLVVNRKLGLICSSVQFSSVYSHLFTKCNYKNRKEKKGRKQRKSNLYED